MTGPAIPGAGALRVFYAFQLLATGALVPYLPAFVKALDLTGAQIAIVLSCAPLAHLCAPLVWGALADRSQRPDRVLACLLLGAALASVPFACTRSFPAVLACNMALQLFFTPLSGLTDSLAILRVRYAGDDYGRIRVFGSLAFVVSVFGVGQLLAHFQDSTPEGVLWPAVLAILFLATFIASLFLRGQSDGPRPRLRDTRRLLGDRRFLFLLAMGAVHWGATAPFHGFFAIMTRDMGLPTTVVGQAFALSVLAEVVVFFFACRLLNRLSLSCLLALATSGSALRWGLTGHLSAPALLVAVQILHACTFGVFWTTAIAWLQASIPPGLRATGQTLFTGAVFGLGYLAGLLGTGLVYERTGRVAPAFMLAGMVSLLQTVYVVAVGPRLQPGARARAP